MFSSYLKKGAVHSWLLAKEQTGARCMFAILRQRNQIEGTVLFIKDLMKDWKRLCARK